MADNYRFTAERTQRSSEALHTSQNFFDACYLAGYVVECYMKVLYKHVTNSDPAHIHDLIELKEKLKSVKRTAKAAALLRGGFWIDIELKCQRIYNNWDPRFRYNDTQSWDETASTDFQSEIKKCLAQIARLRTSGLIK